MQALHAEFQHTSASAYTLLHCGRRSTLAHIATKNDVNRMVDISHSSDTSWRPAAIPMKDYLRSGKHKEFRWEDGAQHRILQPALRNTDPYPMTFERRLGHSRTAVVDLVFAPVDIRPRHDLPLALKVINCSAAELTPDFILRQEVKIMECIEHIHIVKYVASYQTPEKFGIIMYPPGKCDLEKYMHDISDELEQIQSGKQSTLSEQAQDCSQHLACFFACLAQALSYLERKDIKIKHKDIKPKNIVVDDFDSPLLTDFGIAQQYPTEDGQHTTGPTAKSDRYASPEALDGKERDYRSDVFSLGCVFLEMATILLGITLVDLENHLVDGGKGIMYGRTIERNKSWVKELMKRCEEDSEGRPRHSRSKSGGQRAVLLRVLPVIGEMLALKKEKRPHANTLWKHFSALSPRHCPSCKLQHESNTSDPNGDPRQPYETSPPGSRRSRDGSDANEASVETADTSQRSATIPKLRKNLIYYDTEGGAPRMISNEELDSMRADGTFPSVNVSLVAG